MGDKQRDCTIARSACHIGNGQSSTYQPNMATDLITPVLDMSDAISNPTRTNGIAFFFTGSVATGILLKHTV